MGEVITFQSDAASAFKAFRAQLGLDGTGDSASSDAAEPGSSGVSAAAGSLTVSLDAGVSGSLLTAVFKYVATSYASPASVASSSTSTTPVVTAKDLEDFESAVQDLMVVLAGSMSKSVRTQVYSLLNQIDAYKLSIERLEKAQRDNINQQSEAGADAAGGNKNGKVLGWIAAVFALIGAAIATVLTAGGGSELLLGASLLMLAASGWNLVNKIVQECGGPDVGVANLLKMLGSAFFKACGLEQKEADDAGAILMGMLVLCAAPSAVLVDPAIAGNIASGLVDLAERSEGVSAEKREQDAGTAEMVVTILAMLTGLVVTGGAAAGAVADKGAAVAEEATTFASRLMTWLKSSPDIWKAVKYSQAASVFADGVTAAGGAGCNLYGATRQFEADQLKAESTRIEASVSDVQIMIDNISRLIKHASRDLNDLFIHAAGFVQGAGQQSRTINHLLAPQIV